MFPDLNNLLDTDLGKIPDEQFIAICNTNADGSFLLHHYISLYIKGGHNVCLIAFSQSFSHYNAVGQKLGINLIHAKEKGQLIIIEGLKIFDARITNKLCTEPQVDTIKKGADNPFDFVLKNNNSLHALYLLIRDAYKAMKKSSPNTSCVIVLDDLSMLSSLGASGRDIIALLHYLKVLLNLNEKISLIALVHNDKDIEDDDNDLVWKWMCHESDVTLQASGLDSGFCKDVHGQLVVTWRNCAQTMHMPTRQMQYKIQDKNVSLFAFGTSSAVL